MAKWISTAIQVLPGIILLAGVLITGIVYLVQLESDVDHLQVEVSELQISIDEVRIGVGEVKAGQQRILDSLGNIEVALGNHVHEADGTVRVTLPSH